MVQKLKKKKKMIKPGYSAQAERAPGPPGSLMTANQTT